VDIVTGYKVTCKESDQDHVYIILYKFSKVWIPEFLYRELLRKWQ
jgi:hypothetical protein